MTKLPLSKRKQRRNTGHAWLLVRFALLGGCAYGLFICIALAYGSGRWWSLEAWLSTRNLWFSAMAVGGYCWLIWTCVRRWDPDARGWSPSLHRTRVVIALGVAGFQTLVSTLVWTDEWLAVLHVFGAGLFNAAVGLILLNRIRRALRETNKD